MRIDLGRPVRLLALGLVGVPAAALTLRPPTVGRGVAVGDLPLLVVPLFRRPRTATGAFRPRRISRFVLRSTSSPEDDVGTASAAAPPPAATTLRTIAAAPALVTVRRKYETFAWKHEGRTFNINYRAEGPADGQPLLLVHGFGANVNHFRYQFRDLPSERYRVYALDLLGFGASDKPPDAPYSIELFAQLLQDFVQSQGKDVSTPWIVAGNSIGGLASLCLAASVPDRIQSVVLFNCAGGMTGFRYEDVPWYLRPLLYVVQTVVLGPYYGPRFFANFKTRDNVETILKQQGVYGDPTNVDEELLEILLGPSDDDGAEQVFLKVFAGPPGPTPESVLPNVKCPILGLWGSADPWTPVDRGAHPGCNFGQYAGGDFELVVLDGVGHCPHDECPDRVHAVMLPWLKEKANSNVRPNVGL